MPAIQDIIRRLSLSGNEKDRKEATIMLQEHFESLPDKSAAWDDIHRLTIDENSIIRYYAAEGLGSAFKYVPEDHKSAAWDDLIRLISDKDSYVRNWAAYSLGSAFEYVSDKSAALYDLHKLSYAESSWARRGAAKGLGSAFKYITEEYKSTALDDLHRLIGDKDVDVREKAAESLGSAFKYVLEYHKSAVWDDLHRLTRDENSIIRYYAAEGLGSAFKYIPEYHKSAAWDDLHRLTRDEDLYVQKEVAIALGSVFKYIPEEYKSTALDDLHKLTIDWAPIRMWKAKWSDAVQRKHIKITDVRRHATSSIGHAFTYIPEEFKSEAWSYLHELTNDEDSEVKIHANYSLGKICIYNASKSENEDDSKILFGEALLYFEKAAQEGDSSNPAKFCNLFYRSFDAVLFKKVYSKKEIEDYIVAAKREIGNSESKQKLVEVVEQLAEVLEIAHSAREAGIESQELIKRCSLICNHVDQLMDENKDKTPALHGLYEKAKPSFDKTIKELIDEVKEKAEAACRQARGTPAEDAACAVSREVHKWKIGSQEYMGIQVQCTVSMLRSYVSDIEDNNSILNEINSILQEEDVVIQYMRFNSLVPQIINIRESRITEFSDEMKALRKAVSKLSESIDELQNPQEYLDKIQRNLEEIKDEIPAMKKQIDDLLLELYSPMGIDQKLKVAIPIIPLLVSYEIETNLPKFIVDKIDELKNLVMKGRK